MATLCVRASDGFSKTPFVAALITGYVASFALLGLAVHRDLPLGVAYGIWAAVGVAAIALLSVPLFGETLSWVQLGGLGLVALGVFALEAGGTH